MARVEIHANPMAGSSHVWAKDGRALFTAGVWVNDVLVVGLSPEYKAWLTKVEEGKGVENFKEIPPCVYLDLGQGDGFMELVIRHADDRTWEMLQSLDAEEWVFGSTRDEFRVIVRELIYHVMAPPRIREVA